MLSIHRVSLKTALLIYAVSDLLCVSMGMGVPIFCILLGFPVGWYIARRAINSNEEGTSVLKSVLKSAIVTSAFTFVGMSLIWGRCLFMLFNPSADFRNFGIPLILYDPKLSFVGWIVLMIVISPFLQLLTTIFASYLVMLKQLRS
ncbi:MAG: hypothetical protein WCE90_04885 [Candidatus Zixiibacteriota bacterium]